MSILEADFNSFSIPNENVPVIDEDGQMTREWYAFFKKSSDLQRLLKERSN